MDVYKCVNVTETGFYVIYDVTANIEVLGIKISKRLVVTFKAELKRNPNDTLSIYFRLNTLTLVRYCVTSDVIRSRYKQIALSALS